MNFIESVYDIFSCKSSSRRAASHFEYSHPLSSFSDAREKSKVPLYGIPPFLFPESGDSNIVGQHSMYATMRLSLSQGW
jgi:hypothetical protein